MAETMATDALVVLPQPDDPGLRFRRYRGPVDLPGMAAANQAMRDADGIVGTASAEQMTVQYANLTNCDPDRDILIVERIDGIVADDVYAGIVADDVCAGIVGYGRVEWRDLTDGTRSFASIIVMDPAVRTASLARAMLAWSEARNAANARHVPDRDRIPAVMQAYTVGDDPTLPAVLHATGWQLQGRGYEMLREPLDDVPDLPIPDGLDLRAIPDDEAGRKAVWAALVDAFRDHRDEPEASEEDWRQFRDEPKHDISLWVIAFDGDEIAGGALGLVDPELIAHHGVQRGYVDAVFTRRPWRRRGLARAAVARVLARFRDRGMTSAFLEVDGLNPNQAMGLYESLGFAIVTTSTDWSKPLPDDHERDPRT